MPTNYQAISDDNVEQLGKDRASRMSQVTMYADTAHFIYELLQNADDAEANEISFILEKNKLIIEHNGIPFTEDNVKAISYFGKGKTDLTKIGHFGLGFKSVFAYTASPEIYSGNENFVITDLYSLAALKKPNNLEENITRFVLPFNHSELKPNYIESTKLKTATLAFDEISNKLKNLNSDTLLFTRNLAKIYWQIDKLSETHHRFQQVVEDNIYEINIKNNNINNYYLIFNKPIIINNNNNNRLVQVAYKLNDSITRNGKIIALPNTKFFVFFKTDLESHSGLIIQAPFVTTPARDNIPKEERFNIKLANQIGDLIIESLHKLKKLKLLTIEVLNLLPLEILQFSDNILLETIFKIISSSLTKDKLILTNNNTYAEVKFLKISNDEEFKRIFDNKKLDLLFNTKGLQWASSNLQPGQNYKIYKFINSNLYYHDFYKINYDIDSVDDLIINHYRIINLLSSYFFEQQSDAWLLKFTKYVFNNDPYSFLECPIIRLENNLHVTASDKIGNYNAFIPGENSNTNFLDFNFVKKSLLTNKYYNDYLTNYLDISNVDTTDFIANKILPKYNNLIAKVNKDEYINDFNIIIDGLNTKNSDKRDQLINQLKNKKIILCKRFDDSQITRFLKPSDCYFDNDDLNDYFENNSEFFKIFSKYYNKEALKILKELGVADSPRVRKAKPDNYNNLLINNSRGNHSRGLNRFDYFWQIDGLEHALKKPSLSKCKFIWMTLIENIECVSGTIEFSTQKNYENPTKKFFFSKIVNNLINTNWLLDSNGNFRKPAELSLYELNKELETKSNNAKVLSEKLNMKIFDFSEYRNILNSPTKNQVLLLLNNMKESDAIKVLQTIQDNSGASSKFSSLKGMQGKDRNIYSDKSEHFAFQWELNRLQELGLSNINEKIVDKRKDKKAGFDFLTNETETNKRYIEVKTIGQIKNNKNYRFYLSDNEYRISKLPKYEDSYYFYLVKYNHITEPIDLIPIKASEIYKICKITLDREIEFRLEL